MNPNLQWKVVPPKFVTPGMKWDTQAYQNQLGLYRYLYGTGANQQSSMLDWASEEYNRLKAASGVGSAGTMNARAFGTWPPSLTEMDAAAAETLRSNDTYPRSSVTVVTMPDGTKWPVLENPRWMPTSTASPAPRH